MPRSLSRDRLVALLDAAARAGVAVVGDAMLDVYLRGDVERISPEAPVPVVRVRERRYALGGAANVAQNVRRPRRRLRPRRRRRRRRRRDDSCARCSTRSGADADALVDGRPPDDARRRAIVARVAAARPRRRGGGRGPRRRTTSTRIARGGAHARSRDADALVLEDYNKGVLVPRGDRGRDRAGARQRASRSSSTPSTATSSRYRGATVFKPNRRELEAALGAAVDLDHPEALPATLARLGVEHLLLTLGERGMVLISARRRGDARADRRRARCTTSSARATR